MEPVNNRSSEIVGINELGQSHLVNRLVPLAPAVLISHTQQRLEYSQRDWQFHPLLWSL